MLVIYQTYDMKLTLLEAPNSAADKYKQLIMKKPGAIDDIVEMAKKQGTDSHTLRGLYDFAFQQGLIDRNAHGYGLKRLNLSDTRKLNKLDQGMAVCVSCKKPIMTDEFEKSTAQLYPDLGWLCGQCLNQGVRR